jgi:hypothetical protein
MTTLASFGKISRKGVFVGAIKKSVIKYLRISEVKNVKQEVVLQYWPGSRAEQLVSFKRLRHSLYSWRTPN